MRTISRPSDTAAAWAREYARLARAISLLLPKGPIVIGEIGCGRGQLTVPFSRASPRARIFAVDRFSGPYSGHRKALEEALRRADLSENVSVVAGDGLEWLARQPTRTLRAVISSEFLPELTRGEMSAFFRSSFHVLLPGGVTVHAFLSPDARNRRQELTIEADSNPLWTRHPPGQWFSPPVKLARDSLGAAGFCDVGARTLRSHFRFVRSAASQQLRKWSVRPSFDRQHREDLVDGLELPDWILLTGIRPG